MAGEKLYVIREEGFDSGLFWNNANGWGPLEDATVFTEKETKELNLPGDGVWVQLPEFNPDQVLDGLDYP